MTELKNLSKEQLKALGLNDDQINAILGVVNQDNGSGGLPFPLIKINYDSDYGKVGSFAIQPKKDEEGQTIGFEKVFSNPVKVRFLKSMYQYSKFDATQNKPTVTSNIFALKDAKKAYDLKTGAAIKQLKEMDEDIKFQRVTLMEIIDGDEKYVGIAYLKGAYLYELNEQLRKYDNEGHLNKVFTIKHNKKKKGSVVYYVPSVEEVEDYDFIKTIKEDSANIAKFDKWVEEVNNGGETETQPQNPPKQAPQTDDDEDINWDD